MSCSGFPYALTVVSPLNPHHSHLIIPLSLATYLLSNLPQPQPDIRQYRSEQYERQHRRTVFVVIHPLRVTMPDAVRPIDKDDRRVRDRRERCEGEQPRADDTDGVFWRYEVEQRCGDRADVDGEVQPFL